MKNNCIICKRRKTCLNYQLGGLLVNTYCDLFQEEKQLSEEEQIALEEQNSEKHTRRLKD